MSQATHKACSMCGTSRRVLDFYKSYSQLDKIDERIRVCKVCLKENVNTKDVNSIKNMMRQLDKPFHPALWDSALTKPDAIGEYFKLINAKDYRYDTWADSDKSAVEATVLTEDLSIHLGNKELLNDLKEKYGHGYPDEEYILFEKKFNNLKPSFQLPTTMHEEYLREYCVNKVKETIAKSKGEFKEAKEWAMMAKESAEAGKLKPSQMSKADLSQGLDGFGQLSRMVEEHVDIIPLLPKFTKQPKDDVDITLWLYVNYIRDLQGLPPAEYSELYKFYDDRVSEYMERKLDNSLNVEQGEEDE